MKQFFLLVVQQLRELVHYLVVHLVVAVLDLLQIMDVVPLVRLKLQTIIYLELIILNLHLEPPGGGGAIFDPGPGGWLGIIFFIIAIIGLAMALPPIALPLWNLRFKKYENKNVK